ncbi:MAG: GAF domain-containing protein [Nitrospira sp.]|nr:GAF domain-containing protein [Nitrospira sp.]
MYGIVQRWWETLRVQHKVWAVLLFLCVPLVGGLASHLYVVQRLLVAQQQRHDLLLARHQVEVLRRLSIDIEDAFRGYVITGQSAFLNPLLQAEENLGSLLHGVRRTLEAAPDYHLNVDSIEQRLRELLLSKHQLIDTMQQGKTEQASSYIRSGQGLQLSDTLRRDLRRLEDQLEDQLTTINDLAGSLSQRAFYGLWIALGGVLTLGGIGSVILARSVTRPITRLHLVTTALDTRASPAIVREALASLRLSKDEFGQLATAYVEMTDRIGTQIRELEVLSTIGQDINTIGPDGLEGVLRRIADRAVELVRADVCLVLLRDEAMGCWLVEAASGDWNDSLKKAVMLWEELPVSVQAYQSRETAVGDHFRNDERPQVVRRNLIGDSMLAVPLLSQGIPFGVLSLLSERPRSAGEWNQRLAKGLAQEAALAISNARLYESVQQKQQGLLSRLRQLEHLAETLAHDLKGPGARMEELAKLLAQKFPGQIDDRTARWLKLIQENGSDIVRRVEGILSVARVGAGQGSVTAVDPRLAIDDVLMAQAGEIEQLRATIQIDPVFPLVACHRAYLRQIFDNLISNALKYAKPGEPPLITITSQTEKHTVCFSVRDRGIGIPSDLQARVFQPFVRLGPADVSGSGIGLTIVQRIVELYGGRVWIEGTDDEGCTVKFTMPWLNQELGEAHGAISEATLPDLVNVPPNNLTRGGP